MAEDTFKDTEPSEEDSNDAVSSLEASRKSARANRASSPDLTVDDMLGYHPEDVTSTGALPESTYFPGMNQPTAVGNYSGSIVGNNTLFAAPAYVPFGIVDARQKALQLAASHKAKSDEDFLNRMKAPVTTLTANQPELERKHNEWLNNTIADAQKRYGDNWVRGLKNDPKFHQERQKFETIARYNDDAVNFISNLQEDNRHGRYVPKEAEELSNKIMSGYAGLGDPSATTIDFQDIAKAKSYENYGKVLNQYDKLIQPLVNESLQDPINRGVYNLETLKKDTTYPKLKETAQAIREAHYPDSKYFTVDKIQKDLESMYLGKREIQMQSHANQFAPNQTDGGAGTVEYTEFPEQGGDRSVTLTAVQKAGAEGEPSTRGSVATIYKGTTFQTPRIARIPGGLDVYDPAHGGAPTKGTRPADFNIGSIGIAKFDGSHLLHDEWQITDKDGKHHDNISYEDYVKIHNELPGVKKIVPNIHYKTIVTGTTEGNAGKEQVVVADAVRNNVINDVKKNGVLYKGVDLGKWDSEAQKLNKQYKESHGSDEVKIYNIKGKDYSVDKVKLAAEKSGMTIEEYVKAVNKK